MITTTKNNPCFMFVWWDAIYLHLNGIYTRLMMCYINNKVWHIFLWICNYCDNKDLLSVFLRKFFMMHLNEGFSELGRLHRHLLVPFNHFWVKFQLVSIAFRWRHLVIKHFKIICWKFYEILDDIFSNKHFFNGFYTKRSHLVF